MTPPPALFGEKMPISNDMETDVLQFYCDMCELSLELEPGTNTMKHLDSLCNQFQSIMADMGIESPPPSPPDGKVPF